jgi:chaperonin GroES
MLTPINSKMIVKLIEKEVTTASGIVLSRADPVEANRGVVVSVGPEVKDVVVGDNILPNWAAAAKTVYDGETLYILKEEDVVLIFED